MKTDLYTKVILTVIALFLGLHLVKDTNLVTPAQAAPVAIPSPREANATMDVNIVQVNGHSIFGSVLPTNTDVNISKIGGSSVYGSGIPVNVKNSSVAVDVKNSRVPVEVKNSYISTKAY